MSLRHPNEEGPPGPRALHALDEALSRKPAPAHDAFTAATRAMSRYRDDMIDRLRPRGAAVTAGERRRLEHANAVLSMLLAGHFPLGEIEWDELQLARGWLADLVREDVA